MMDYITNYNYNKKNYSPNDVWQDLRVRNKINNLIDNVIRLKHQNQILRGIKSK